MPKRISKTLLFIAMIAIVALFAATEVMADFGCEAETYCYTQNEWKITLTGPGSLEDCDSTDNTVNCYGYKFTIEGPPPRYSRKGLDHIYWFKPDCCYNKIDMFQTGVTGDPEHYCFPVGAGETTMKYGQGNFQASTCKFTANTSETEWPFRASTNKTGEISVCLKVKSAMECCAIRGPVCGDGYQPLSGSKTFTQGEVTFAITYDLAGNSNGVDCLAPATCTVQTIPLNQLRVKKYNETREGTVMYWPYDTPFQATASPGCTYVRTRSGGVKYVCP